MRRLFSLAVLFLIAIPFGVSVSGCSKKTPVTYCDGNDSGPIVGQVSTIDLEPRLTGVSLNAGQIGSLTAPNARDCKSSTVAVSSYTYGTSNIKLIDVEPSNGRLCAGSWNRNTGGGIPDYTVCSGNGGTGVAYVTASAEGAVSNALPVFVHPVVTSIVLGPASTNCTTDPASNCIDLTQPAACQSGVPANPVTSYTGTSCLSQNAAAQLTARTFAGSGASQTNISCLVGPLTFSAQTTSVVTIDENGLATARAPGSTIINAAISLSSSSAGFFATCPPASIVLSAAGSSGPPTAPISVNQNIQQDLVATVTDTNGNPITNLGLEYESTSPTTVPVSGGIVTPTFPGTAAITAICQPPACNTSPFQQIGLYGNGLAVTSNPVLINATGSGNSTVLYVASTQSQYIQPYDFTTTIQNAPVRLPYVPNSLVLSTDLNTIYMGTQNEIMVFSTTTNQVTKEDTSVSGNVLSVSPDSGTVVITDPVRKLVYLYTSAGAISTEYGGVGTHAEWSPDSLTVYITTTDGRLLVHSTFTGWTAVTPTTTPTDVAITIPNAGVYLGGTPVTGRTNCPTTTVNPGSPNPTTTNTFYPLADTTSAVDDRLAATNDGLHILGASVATGFTDVTVAPKSGHCPIDFASTTGAPIPFVTAIPTAITDVLPTSDSTYTLITYTGNGAVVPEYTLPAKTLINIPLQTSGSAAPVAPIAGVISSDNQTAYIGTTGDNLVHQLTRNASGFSDTIAPLNPALPAATGSGTAVPDLLAQRPRRATS